MKIIEIRLCMAMIIVAALFNISEAQAAPPIVLSTLPMNNQNNVDVNLDIISITFDKEMMQSFSYNSDYWPYDSDRYWSSDKKVFYIKRKNSQFELPGQTTFTFTLNPIGYPEFRDTAGEYLEPYTFSFKTGNNSPLAKGVVISRQADSIIPYDWFYYIPTNVGKIHKSFIMVRAEGGNNDYSLNSQATFGEINYMKSWAEDYGIILLFASIPRSDIYAVSFDRRCFYSSTDQFFQRPDFKVNLMIDTLTEELINDEYNIQPKVLLEGFSNGAMFAQRYALLHPERVQAVAAGQCGGFITFPYVTYSDRELNWAIGINDLNLLSGINFESNIYKQVPQFIFIGSLDNNNSHFLWPNPDGFWTQEDINFVNQHFGDSDPVRIQNQCANLVNSGHSIQFKLYPGIGHEYNNEMLTDVFTFFSEKMNNSSIIIRVPLDFATIQEAINNANDGDTIEISDGVYKGIGNRNIRFFGKKITVKSTNKTGNCIIDCENSGQGFIFDFNETAESVLDGITIINGVSEMGGALYFSQASPTIINCTLENNSAMHGAGIWSYRSSPVFKNCLFKNNSATGSGSHYFHSSSPNLINCIINNNSAGHGGGLFFYDSTGIVVNCAIIRNTAGGAGGLFFNISNTSVVNTIIWDNSPDQLGFENSLPPIQNCIIQNGYSGGINIIELNPKFIDINNGNFRLYDDSPAIDNGVIVSGVMPLYDFDGKPRILGLHPDIGAFEYGGCSGDSDYDGDVDGFDLYGFIFNGEYSEINSFAPGFGKNNCF